MASTICLGQWTNSKFAIFLLKTSLLIKLFSLSSIPKYCGSCWAQGTLSAIADRFIIADRKKYANLALSVEMILNCRAGGSCEGMSLLILERSYVHSFSFQVVLRNRSTSFWKRPVCLTWLASNMMRPTMNLWKTVKNLTWIYVGTAHGHHHLRVKRGIVESFKISHGILTSPL